MIPMLRTSVPFAPMGATLNRLDSLFDQFLGEDGGSARSSGVRPTAPVSMWQDEDNLYIEAELPGVDEKDVEATIHEGVLVIKASRDPVEGRAYLYNGRGFGRFERSIVLPELVDSDRVEATLSAGVLSLVLPKHPASRPRKITLKSS